MRRSLILIAAGVLAACDDTLPSLTPAAEPAAPAALLATSDGSIPGHYIVSVDWGTDARLLALDYGIQPRYVYEHLINGFAGPIPSSVVDVLAADPRVLK